MTELDVTYAIVYAYALVVLEDMATWLVLDDNDIVTYVMTFSVDDRRKTVKALLKAASVLDGNVKSGNDGNKMREDFGAILYPRGIDAKRLREIASVITAKCF